jgi:hypothetical protein
MSEMPVAEVAWRVREWARGSLPVGAGVELLLRAFDGRFADPSRPWVITGAGGHVWVDTEVL